MCEGDDGILEKLIIFISSVNTTKLYVGYNCYGGGGGGGQK